MRVLRRSLFVTAAVCSLPWIAGGCPAPEPDPTVGLNSKVVVDGEELTPNGVEILASPGAAEIASGKQLLVVMTITSDQDDDRSVLVELPALSEGTFDIRPFGAPGVVMPWEGTRYRARSGTADVKEAGAREGERVEIALSDLVMEDDCGTATLDVGDIVIAGTVSEALEENVAEGVGPLLGFIDTVVHLPSGDVPFVGRFIADPGSQPDGLYDGESFDNCAFTHSISLLMTNDVAAGAYDADFQNLAFTFFDVDDTAYFWRGGTIRLDDAPAHEDHALLRGSVSGVLLRTRDGVEATADDASFVVSYEALPPP